MTENKQPTCKERVQPALESTLETLRLLWKGHIQAECESCDGIGEYNRGGKDFECPDCNGTGHYGDEDRYIEDLGNLYEYGLSFDYVAPNTFNDQKEPYWRYQLSWGGSSDEFRIYGNTLNEYSVTIYRIEYWFMDWFDGASITLSGEDYKFIEELILSFFGESGRMYHVLREATEDL